MTPQLAYSRSRHQTALSELSDREILLKIQSADELALDELVRRKTGPLVQVAYRVLGDLEESRDVVQIAFVRVWEKRSSYDSKWSPNTWIYRIVTNLAIDHLRSQKSRDRIAEPLRLIWSTFQLAVNAPQLAPASAKSMAFSASSWKF